MHRLLIAATLGVGLLTGTGISSAAFARPAVEHAAFHTTDRPAQVTPVHDAYHRQHYAPPPRDWHRRAHNWHDHASYDRHGNDRYGWR